MDHAVTQSVPTSTAISTTLTETQPVIEIPGVTQAGEMLPCAEGQWEGIQPGVTSEGDLLQWLNSAPVVDQSSLTDVVETSPDGLTVHRFVWSVGEQQWRVIVNVISGTVTSIELPVQYCLYLKDIAEKMGMPEYVLGYKYFTGGGDVYFLNFFYPANGILLESRMYSWRDIDYEGMEARGVVSEETEIARIVCARPGPLADILTSRGFLSTEEGVRWADAAQRWTGFGSITLVEP